jgi:hypothetical protein
MKPNAGGELRGKRASVLTVSSTALLGAPGLSPSHQEVNRLGHHAFSGFVVFHRTPHVDCHGTAWELWGMERTDLEAVSTPIW